MSEGVDSGGRQPHGGEATCPRSGSRVEGLCSSHNRGTGVDQLGDRRLWEPGQLVSSSSERGRRRAPRPAAGRRRDLVDGLGRCGPGSRGGGGRVTPGAAVLRGWECERRRRGSGPATTAEVDGRGLMAGPARDAAASRRAAGSTPARSAASTLGFGGRGLEDASLGADQRSASAPRWPWRLLPGQARRGAEPGNAPAGSWPATGEPAITAAARPAPSGPRTAPPRDSPLQWPG